MSMWYTSDDYVHFRSFVRKKIMCRGLLKTKFLTQQVLLKKKDIKTWANLEDKDARLYNLW